MRRTSRLDHAALQDVSPRAILGPAHPLVLTTDRLALALERCGVVAALLMAGAAATIDGLQLGLPLLAAAAVVLAALVLQAAALASARHLQVLQVIAQGRGAQIRIVEDERRRLRSRECRESIARSLDDLRERAGRSGRGHGALGPIFKPWVIRAASADLARLATSVREDHGPGVRGVAMLERLLVDGCSPLYGDNPELLQQELRRARFLLETRTEIPLTGNGGDDHRSAGRRLTSAHESGSRR